MNNGINTETRKKYAVVYTYEDLTGGKRQKWETFSSKKEASKRKAAVENELNNGTFTPPNDITVKVFLQDLYPSHARRYRPFAG